MIPLQVVEIVRPIEFVNNAVLYIFFSCPLILIAQISLLPYHFYE